MACESDFMKWIDHQMDPSPLLRQRGMTQAQLAKELGVSQPHIAKLEAGRAKNIERHTLCRWATALGAKPTVDVVRSGARKRTAT